MVKRIPTPISDFDLLRKVGEEMEYLVSLEGDNLIMKKGFYQFSFSKGSENKHATVEIELVKERLRNQHAMFKRKKIRERRQMKEYEKIERKYKIKLASL